MRHCADNYLLSEHKSIRLEAVKTCSSLLKGTLRSLSGRRSDTVISTINEVLAKLLTVGITDQGGNSIGKKILLKILTNFPSKNYNKKIVKKEFVHVSFSNLSS